jgi:hypothetical protein
MHEDASFLDKFKIEKKLKVGPTKLSQHEESGHQKTNKCPNRDSFNYKIRIFMMFSSLLPSVVIQRNEILLFIN